MRTYQVQVQLMNSQSAELIIPAQISGLVLASTWLNQTTVQLGIESKVAFAMDLCLEELVTNTIKYGLDEETAKEQQICVTVENRGEIVRLTLVDQARAFDPSVAREEILPENVEAAAIGGLGLHLVRRLTYRIQYDREGGSNKLVLDFSSGSEDR